MSTLSESLKKKVLEEIDAVLARAGISGDQTPSWKYFEDRNDAELTRWGIAWVATIDRWTPPGSRYREVLQAHVEAPLATASNVAGLVGLLRALRDDYQAGYVTSVAEVVHADLFADFLEMAAELLNSGYKDAAAVIAGSVLEEHLRKLADKTGVAVVGNNGAPRKADAINADLVKKGAYNKLVQKQVTAWLDLRNKAAHGHYSEYDKHQVEVMLEGIRGFLVGHPA